MDDALFFTDGFDVFAYDFMRKQMSGTNEIQ